jgi:hypothetical protein
MLFMMMLVLAAVVTMASHVPLNFKYIFTMYIRYFILLSNIIPVQIHGSSVDFNESKP